MWMVAFYTGVRPMRWLARPERRLRRAARPGPGPPLRHAARELGHVTRSIPWRRARDRHGAPSPHPSTSWRTRSMLAAFAFMFYAAWRVRPARRATQGVARSPPSSCCSSSRASSTRSQDYGVLSDLYFTQLSFVVLVFAVSVGLRQESLQDEAELRAYRAHLESLVDERVKELDEANARLALEVQERLATEESLRRRVAELNALQRVSRTLADRSDLDDGAGPGHARDRGALRRPVRAGSTSRGRRGSVRRSDGATDRRRRPRARPCSSCPWCARERPSAPSASPATRARRSPTRSAGWPRRSPTT